MYANKNNVVHSNSDFHYHFKCSKNMFMYTHVNYTIKYSLLSGLKFGTTNKEFITLPLVHLAVIN